ncbi:DUF4924 family protein [Limibacter armeniacum]|uniref:DUF4924 family protein n=1 Tax=Limibacter armeniacum TaxID=466084 RepID=UPI002FE65DD7
MNIAAEKKKKNIAEYIVFMYQSEDLIRAFDCDMTQVDEYVIKHVPANDVEKVEIKAWYAQLKDQMEKDGVLEQGHTSTVQKEVQTLSDLHTQLLADDEDYQKIYEDAKSAIETNLKAANGLITDEIQICLNGIYGLLLLRMRGKTVNEEMQQQLEKFGDVLSYLSFRYKEIYS